MADTFTPRGAPVPANSYDGWELTNRPAMLPFLAEYTNALGEKSGGWAMPSMVTEPVNALSRLLDTPAGTMPDPRNEQNQRDALTGLMALYGGNAVGGVARNAMSRGVAMGRPNMEAARPVAYSNAIDAAMSNPNMLSMMRDIDYANLNRRALEEYGVGYEGLSSSQEAKLRGWSDPALLSDTGKPNPVGAALASSDRPGFTAYHGSPHDFDKFDMSKIGSGEGAQAYGHGLYFADNENVAKSYRDSLKGNVLHVDGLPMDRTAAADELANRIEQAIPTAKQPYNSAKMLSGWLADGLTPEQIKSRISAGAWPDELKSELNAVADRIAGSASQNPGHMYQVRINADPNAFLDWDKPLSQQNDAVRSVFKDITGRTIDNQAIKNYDDALYAALFDDGSTNLPKQPYDPTGATAYQIFGVGKQNTTQALREAGIPGIKYYDQMSRGNGDGTRNYVVFDDSLIEILKKYGLLAPGAAVGANALMPPDKNQ